MSTAVLEKSFVQVMGRRMAYHSRGKGRPFLFLHGNPTSSYLWRDVLPELETSGRLIAPDLIGMGDSEKLPNPDASTYTFKTHRDYIWAFIEEVIGAEPVILVVHDWGSALGFNWAYHHRDRVAGIAYMESIVRALQGWDEFKPEAVDMFKAFRSEAGEELVLKQNQIVEGLIPFAVQRQLSEAEMAEYRRPFLASEDRWPTLTWPRQIPIAGEPAEVAAIVDEYASWLATSDIPKLFINAEPGGLVIGAMRDFCRAWPNQSEVTVSGIHYVQEDSGSEIGKAVAQWASTLDTVSK